MAIKAVKNITQRFSCTEISIVFHIHGDHVADQVFASVSTTELDGEGDGGGWEKQNSDGAPNLSFPLQRTIFVTMVGS